MIAKSGYRFSEKIMLKQQAKAKYRINLKLFRFSGGARGVTGPGIDAKARIFDGAALFPEP
jgi:hypothetical protein